MSASAADLAHILTLLFTVYLNLILDRGQHGKDKECTGCHNKDAYRYITGRHDCHPKDLACPKELIVELMNRLASAIK